MARRVGSARAAKVALNGSVRTRIYPFSYVTERLYTSGAGSRQDDSRTSIPPASLRVLHQNRQSLLFFFFRVPPRGAAFYAPHPEAEPAADQDDIRAESLR
jgi:hypothetical protein